MLWVTSFNQELYEASGKALFSSFKKTETEGSFLAGMDKMFLLPFGIGYNLSSSEILNKWLEDNKYIIPESLGGVARPCNCIDPYAKSEKGHIEDCHHTWFRRNASRWFRKYVTLQEAFTFGYDIVIWIDADCEFKQQVTEEFINGLLEDKSILYLKGWQREVLEAGVVLYRNDKIVGKLFNDIMERYLTGAFKRYFRWDDCYILQKQLKKYEQYTKDIGTSINGKHSDIFTNSLLGKHIQHNKGKHGRKLGIMK